MKSSSKKDVPSFLKELKKKQPTQYRILTKARSIVRKAYPRVKERIIYGGVMFTLGEKDVGGLFPYTKHVSFEFSNGNTFKDPNRVLEGSGKHRRHIKLHAAEDIKEKNLVSFVSQMGL